MKKQGKKIKAVDSYERLNCDPLSDQTEFEDRPKPVRPGIRHICSYHDLIV